MTTDLDEYRQQARAWVSANLEPAEHHGGMGGNRSGEHMTKEQFAAEKALQKKVYEAGYAGISWPTEYGGQGLTGQHEAIWLEETARHHTPDLGVAGGVTYGVIGPTMLATASPEFLAAHIPKMLAAEELFAQFFSEPGAGSDLAGVTTRADRDGDRWILNGSKIWSSGAADADWGMCLARTDWDAPKHRGLTWFAVDISKKGVEVQPIREINGSSEFCQEYFTDVELSDGDVIGEVNQGWRVAQTMLVFERGAGRPGSDKVPEGAGRLAPDLVALAKRLGREQEPHVRQLIAQAHINDFGQRQLGYRVAGLLKKSKSADAGIAAYGKLAMGSLGAARARMSLEIGGSASLTWAPGDADGQAASLRYLNGRLGGIAGGTNEVQRNGIGERVLGLPREPAFDIHKPFREVVRDVSNWSGS